MLIYKIVTVEHKELEKVICDLCKKQFDDNMEIQEFHHIRFTGGYSSVFGDGADVSCDLCKDGFGCAYDCVVVSTKTDTAIKQQPSTR